MDSSWDISVAFYDKYFAQQADDEDCFWFDGLYGERKGDYVRKPMAECTGDEVLQEFLYHLGMLDRYGRLRDCAYVSLSMMPYITSQFMPRNSEGDRPRVFPKTAATTPSLASTWSWTATWSSPSRRACAPP